MNREEVEGKAEALKGKIKQGIGHVNDDPELHDEGVVDEVEGKTRATLGKAKRKVGNVIEDIGKATKK